MGNSIGDSNRICTRTSLSKKGAATCVVHRRHKKYSHFYVWPCIVWGKKGGGIAVFCTETPVKHSAVLTTSVPAIAGKGRKTAVFVCLSLPVLRKLIDAPSSSDDPGEEGKKGKLFL